MSTQTQELIKSPNRFEQDFGRVTSAEREQVITVLQVFMAEIREVLDQSMRMVGIISPEMEERCATCAFNTLTDRLPGFAPIAYGLLHAISSDKVFLCHGDQVTWKANLLDPNKVELCNGFGSVRLFSGTKASQAALRAMAAIREIIPEKR